MLPLHLHDQLESSSSVTFKLKEKISGLFRLIFSDKNSRNLLGFLGLNLSFAIVELLYGVWTNSLGLISDSFHMFFDCTALLAGLAATVIARSARKFPALCVFSRVRECTSLPSCYVSSSFSPSSSSLMIND